MNISISLGSSIDCININNEIVSGSIESILKNTVIIRNDNGATHLIKKSDLKKSGYSLNNKQTALHNTPGPSILKLKK